jgi:hypothetical protein
VKAVVSVVNPGLKEAVLAAVAVAVAANKAWPVTDLALSCPFGLNWQDL